MYRHFVSYTPPLVRGVPLIPRLDESGNAVKGFEDGDFSPREKYYPSLDGVERNTIPQGKGSSLSLCHTASVGVGEAHG